MQGHSGVAMTPRLSISHPQEIFRIINNGQILRNAGLEVNLEGSWSTRPHKRPGEHPVSTHSKSSFQQSGSSTISSLHNRPLGIYNCEKCGLVLAHGEVARYLLDRTIKWVMELAVIHGFNWWRGQDSNLGPLGYEGNGTRKCVPLGANQSSKYAVSALPFWH